ncbi:MAG: CBS domain-containing protein [Proteobacteria bacterium]|nr:CBS domain-containing protein [Pseudomonadota bacterium]
MKVKDIMVEDLATHRLNDELSLADDIMQLGRIGHLPVVEEGRLVGIINQRDLFKASLASAMGYGEKAKREFMKTAVVKEVMVNEVITISPESSIEEAGKVMLAKGIGCLPVVEEGNLIGLIMETDILRPTGSGQADKLPLLEGGYGKEGFISAVPGCMHSEGQGALIAVWPSFNDESQGLQDVIPGDDLYLPIALAIWQDNL